MCIYLAGPKVCLMASLKALKALLRLPKGSVCTLRGRTCVLRPRSPQPTSLPCPTLSRILSVSLSAPVE